MIGATCVCEDPETCWGTGLVRCMLFIVYKGSTLFVLAGLESFAELVTDVQPDCSPNLREIL